MRGRVTLRFGDHDQVVEFLPEPDGASDAAAARVQVGDQTLTVLTEAGMVRVEGTARGPAWAVVAGDSRWVYYDGCVYQLELQTDGGRRRKRQDGSLAAPMPATVRQIRVRVGDVVARGDTLIVLEAMKMELPIRATGAGTIAAIHCAEGDLVQPGRPLVELTGPAGT